MFTAYISTHQDVKRTILKQCQDPEGVLQVIIATVAFRMGIDASSVQRVIQWGESLTNWMSRRDGLPAQAV